MRVCGSMWGTGLLALPLFVGCASSTGPAPGAVCLGTEAVALPGGSCIVVAPSLAAHADGASVVSWVTGAFPDIRAALDLSEVEIRLAGAGQLVIPEVGVGGYATDRTVDLHIDLNAGFDLEFRRDWIEQLLAHELHHVARLRAVGNPRSVGALVAFEGLADRFAIDFGGRSVAPWSSALSGTELMAWVDRILDEHPRQDYSVDAWMFGTTPEIPRWTGYSAGYAIAGAYLELEQRSAAAAAGDDADDIIERVASSR